MPISDDPEVSRSHITLMILAPSQLSTDDVEMKMERRDSTQWSSHGHSKVTARS